MDQNISPLPWREDAYLVGQINSATGGKVARACDCGPGYHIDPDQVERCSNAAFIVRACNSHDQLVRALRAARQRLEFANKKLDCDEEIAVIDAALAAAEAA